MTCTDSTADRTRSADCTGFSRPPVPRPASTGARHGSETELEFRSDERIALDSVGRRSVMSQTIAVHEGPASPCSPASTLRRKPGRLPLSRAAIPVHGASVTVLLRQNRNGYGPAWLTAAPVRPPGRPSALLPGLGEAEQERPSLAARTAEASSIRKDYSVQLSSRGGDVGG
jgi:hypothetical protein